MPAAFHKMSAKKAAKLTVAYNQSGHWNGKTATPQMPRRPRHYPREAAKAFGQELADVCASSMAAR